MTLRHRIIEGQDRGTWTLKTPESTDGPLLRRTEVAFVGERALIPQEILEALHGLMRHEPLQQRVELDTNRQRLILLDEPGRAIAEIDDDMVTVTGGPRDGLQFRQVELELHHSDPRVLRNVTSRLKNAGLSPETTQKIARAMDFPDAPETRPPLNRDSLLGDVVRLAITQGLIRLLEQDWRLRLEVEHPDPESVHQARVATRRLRSDLKTFQAVFDPVWLGHVRNDLKWLGAALGRVRDTDVLAKQLESAPATLNGIVAGQRALAARAMSTTLDSRRYLLLLDHLDAATHAPPFLSTDPDIRPDNTASEVLPVLIRTRWLALRREVRKAGDHPSNDRFHRIRIKAKQLRYAAEVATPVLGKPAKRAGMAAETIQTLLGELHDAVTAESWLKTQAEGGLSSIAAFEAGRLAAKQRRIQKQRRKQWPREWRRLRGRASGDR